MAYAIIKRSALEQLMSDENITKAREIAEQNARANREEYVVLAEVGAAVPQQTPVAWVASNVVRTVAAPQPPPTTKADTVTPAQEKPAKGAARRVEQPVTAAQPTQPLFTEPAPATAATNGAGRPKNPQIRGVKLPANVLVTAGQADALTVEQRRRLDDEGDRLGIALDGTVKEWLGYSVDEINTETADCLLAILAKVSVEESNRLR